MRLIIPRNSADKRPSRLTHFCGWDRNCREFYSPWYLYLHFLVGKDGHSVRIDLTPPRVRRRNEEWFNSLDWKDTTND